MVSTGRPASSAGPAQLPNPRVGLEAAGEQDGGDVDAAHRRHADRQQQIVAVARGDHHRSGPQLLTTVGQGAGAQRHVHDAPVQLALVEGLGIDHVHDVPHPRRDQFALPGNAAQQPEGRRPVPGALVAQFFLAVGIVTVFGAAEIEADVTGRVHRRAQQVEDAAQHPFVVNAAVGAGHDFHGFRDLPWRVAAGRGDDDDLGIQALRHFGVKVSAVGLFLGVHQTLDHDGGGVLGGLLVAGDHFFQQDAFPAVAQQVLGLGDRDRFGRGSGE